MREASRTGGGNARVVQELDELTEVAPRRAGSEGERRAARHLQQRLEARGREAELEPTRVRPNFGLAHALHAGTGVVASVLAVYVPALGLVLAAAVTISAFGDLTGSFQLLRMLTPVRASQNVISRDDSDKPGLILLVAHYDAPLTGMLLNRRLRMWPRALLISLTVITVCAGGRLLGIEATWFTVIQFIPTVVLIVMTALCVDVAISETAKGTADNASGVATALRLADSHANKLEHFNLVVVLTGASAHEGLGLRAWLRRHRKELDSEATAVISIDNVARGTAAYAVKEGPVITARMHPTLVELTPESGTSYTSTELSDAVLARAAGVPALRVSSTETGGDAVDPETLARVHEFVAELIEQIDHEIGPELAS
jgi:low affinity Fe/Cu permease